MCEIDNVVSSITVKSITQKEYDELSVKDSSVCYCITDSASIYIDNESISTSIWNTVDTGLIAPPKQKILKRNYCNGCGAPIILGYDKCLYCELPVLYDYI